MRKTQLPRKIPHGTPFVEFFGGVGYEWKCTAAANSEGFWVLLFCRRSNKALVGYWEQKQWFGDWLTVRANIEVEISLIEDGFYERAWNIFETEQEDG